MNTVDVGCGTVQKNKILDLRTTLKSNAKRELPVHPHQEQILANGHQIPPRYYVPKQYNEVKFITITDGVRFRGAGDRKREVLEEVAARGIPETKPILSDFLHVKGEGVKRENSQEEAADPHVQFKEAWSYWLKANAAAAQRYEILDI